MIQNQLQQFRDNYKNAGKEIILQKNVFDQLSDYCTNILKIDSKYIHEQNKLGGNKKKQEGMTRQ